MSQRDIVSQREYYRDYYHRNKERILELRAVRKTEREQGLRPVVPCHRNIQALPKHLKAAAMRAKEEQNYDPAVPGIVAFQAALRGEA